MESESSPPLPDSMASAGLALLTRGAVALKHGKHRSSRKFVLSADFSELRWRSSGLQVLRVPRRRERCIETASIAAVDAQHDSSIHATHPHRLCLSIVLTAAFHGTHQQQLSTRQTLDLSFVDREAFELWAAALRHLVLLRRWKHAASAPLVGTRVRVGSLGSGTAEAFDDVRCCYCVRMDVTGERTACSAHALDALDARHESTSWERAEEAKHSFDEAKHSFDEAKHSFEEAKHSFDEPAMLPAPCLRNLEGIQVASTVIQVGRPVSAVGPSSSPHHEEEKGTPLFHTLQVSAREARPDAEPIVAPSHCQHGACAAPGATLEFFAALPLAMVLDGSERISRSGDEERMQVLNTARSERISRSGDEERMQVLNTARSERISRSGDEERMQVLNTARSERILRSGDEERMQVLNTARSERISRSGDEERMQVLNTARSERISRSGDEGRMQVLNTARSERISRSGDEGEAEDEAEDEADGQIPEVIEVEPEGEGAEGEGESAVESSFGVQLAGTAERAIDGKATATATAGAAAAMLTPRMQVLNTAGMLTPREALAQRCGERLWAHASAQHGATPTGGLWPMPREPHASAQHGSTPLWPQIASPGGLSSTIETLIDGLRLGPARTAAATEAARAWFMEQGYADSSELLEVRAESELALAIQHGACLKPGKARLLAKRLADLALNLAPISPPPPTADQWAGYAGAGYAGAGYAGAGYAGASPAVVPMGLPVLHAHAPVLSPPALVTATELGLADPALPLEAMDWRRLAQAYERAETLAETRGVLDRT